MVLPVQSIPKRGTGGVLDHPRMVDPDVTVPRATQTARTPTDDTRQRARPAVPGRVRPARSRRFVEHPRCGLGEAGDCGALCIESNA